MRFRKPLLAAVSAAVMAAASMSAHAGLIMTIDDLSTAGVDVTVPGFGSPETAFYFGAVGTWSLNVSTGLGNGWSSVFGIDLNSLTASSAAGGTLVIKLTQTDLNFGGAPGPLGVNAAIGGVTQGTISYESWIDDANAAFGHGVQILSGTSTGAFSDAGWAEPSVSDPFSMTLEVTITHSGKKNTSFNFESTVPEPGSLALAGLALLGLAVAGRRKA